MFFFFHFERKKIYYIEKKTHCAAKWTEVTSDALPNQQFFFENEEKR